jgi:hypothetical protein
MCFIPPDFERASLRGDRGNKEVEDSIPALTFFEPRSSVIASNDYGERYWDNFTKASVIASNDWLIVGLLDEVRQFLIPLKEFADLVDANFKKLTFKLVGTSWKTHCYLFKLRLLSCLDTKSVQKTKSLNLKNDKKQIQHTIFMVSVFHLHRGKTKRLTSLKTPRRFMSGLEV